MTTTHYGLPIIAVGQTEKESAITEGFALVDAALGSTTLIEYTEDEDLVLEGDSALSLVAVGWVVRDVLNRLGQSRTLTVPSALGGLRAVANETGQTIVVRNSGPGAVSIPSGGKYLCLLGPTGVLEFGSGG